MAFMGILLIMILFMLPFALIVALIIGLSIFAVIIAFASTITFILLNKYHCFEKWKTDTRKSVRYIGTISYYVLLITMILSYIATIIVLIFWLQ